MLYDVVACRPRLDLDHLARVTRWKRGAACMAWHDQDFRQVEWVRMMQVLVVQAWQRAGGAYWAWRGAAPRGLGLAKKNSVLECLKIGTATLAPLALACPLHCRHAGPLRRPRLLRSHHHLLPSGAGGCRNTQYLSAAPPRFVFARTHRAAGPGRFFSTRFLAAPALGHLQALWGPVPRKSCPGAV